MKRILLLFMTIAVVTIAAMAADVDLTTAQNAARSFMARQVAGGRMRAPAVSNLTLAKAEASVVNPKAVDYYIFNADKSYVVVSGDDQAPEILMYGEEGKLDLNNIPPAMQWLLNKYKYQIDGLKAGTLKANGYAPQTVTAVAPMVTANWDQSAPYNNQCPTSGNRRALTGCPATSLAMCYYKWKWPKTFPACAAINGTTSGGFSASALPAREADWDNIIDEYTGPTNTSSTSTQKDAVAWLMRYAGQAIPDYMYGTSASGADDPEIYQGVLNMGYTNAQYLMLTSWNGWTNSAQKYTDAQWNEWMLAELHAGRPIEYLAYEHSGGGHAFNVFGCDANGKYYVNWGWSGDSNGYCTLHNFTTATGATGQSGSYVFNYGEAMIIGIAPPGPTVNINVSSVNLTQGQSKVIPITGSNLTNDVVVTLDDPDNAFTLSIDGVNQTLNAAPKTTTGAITIPVASINDKTVNLTLGAKSEIEGSATGSLSFASQGAETKTISLSAMKTESDIPDGYAKVTLTAGDVWGDGSGYQMLLDADHNTYGTIIPETQNLTTSGDAPASTYAEFEYKIPENADGSCSTSNIVINNSMTIMIPAGTYDWCIVNPTPNDKIYIASSNGNIPARNDDYIFEAGYTYEFVVSLSGSKDKVDVTITNPFEAGIPTNLTADPAVTTADIAWTPGQNNDTWNLRYRPYVDPALTNRFYDLPLENDGYIEQIGDWYIVDANNDGYNWDLKLTGSNNDNISFYSFSWSSSTGDISPDNWLISPNFMLGGTLKFKAWNHSSSYKDAIEIYVSTNPDWSSTSDFVKIGNTITPAYATGISGAQTYTINLNDYSGVGCIAFRHNSSACWELYVDDIELNVPNPATIPDWIYVNDLTSPNTTLTGLTGETTYEVQVQSQNAADISDWTASTIFTTLDIAPPTIVNVEPTSTTADVTWTKGENNASCNLRYREPAITTFFDSFETGLDSWTLIDSDGDGNNWMQFDPTTFSSGGYPAYDGQYVVMSRSWMSNNALTPDQWMISPRIEDLGGTLRYYIMDDGRYQETYDIYVSTTGTNINNFQKVTNGKMSPASQSWTEETVDLSAYKGQAGYIAFRHYGCTDQDFMLIDAVGIFKSFEGEWIEVDNVTSPYTITDLTPETTYEVQVQGVGGGYTSAWTPSTLFTTLGLEEVTLATLEGECAPGETYTISDQLLVVRASGNKLWAKDANLSIVRRDKPEGQIDYMRELAASGTYAINNMDVTVLNQEGEWDQSNWIVIEFLNSEMTSAVLANYEGKYITSVTGIYSDGVNYTIQVPASTDKNTVDSWIGEVATPAFTPNVYCAANFLSSNLTDAGVTSPHGKVYFFMTPKVQEVFTVTYAVYAGNNKFTLPAREHGMNAAGLRGAFTVDMSYNGGTADLVVGQAYQFTAVASKPATGGSGAPRKINGTGDNADGSFVVMPLDLSGNGNIVTKVGDVKVASREVVGVQYVNAAGISASKPFDGVNMVVTRYSDGSTTVEKRVF